MAISLEETIERQTYGVIGHMMTRQTFWVFVAAVCAFIYLSIATNTFDTQQNLFIRRLRLLFGGQVAMWVATSAQRRPALNSLSARVRAAWLLLPWIASELI